MYARGNDRRRVFRDDVDREIYLDMLGRVVLLTGWRCLAYCLMDNHVHLLLETPEPNLGMGMQRIHGVYAQTYNVRHGRSGHLFQGRYGAVRITSDIHLWGVAAYIARNPVEAGLCECPQRWPWSSHASTLGCRPSPAWLDIGRLLSYFRSMGGDPRERYAEMVGGRTGPVGIG